MKIRAYLYQDTVSLTSYLCTVDNLADDQACEEMIGVLEAQGYTCVLIKKGHDETHHIYVYIVSKCMSN